jgi:hypothetical protein
MSLLKAASSADLRLTLDAGQAWLTDANSSPARPDGGAACC